LPLTILASALDNLGDFPFKNPEDVRFEKPALFVRGTHSNYVPDEALPIVGKFFPLFQLADIEASHWVISEQPEAFRQCESLCMEAQDVTNFILSSRCRLPEASRLRNELSEPEPEPWVSSSMSHAVNILPCHQTVRKA
jgi:hypothetical protein